MLNVLIEIPIVTFGGLYEYWGEYQPLWDEPWFPFPAWVLFLNWLLILTPTAAVLGLMSLRKRHTEWALPIILPCSLFAGHGFAGWPVIAALHSVQTTR